MAHERVSKDESYQEQEEHNGVLFVKWCGGMCPTQFHVTKTEMGKEQLIDVPKEWFREAKPVKLDGE